jgi:S1-C subfamily serine protease
MLGVHCDTGGACVLTSVYYGSGAFEAGLADGDKIVAVDGLAISDFSDLTIAIYPHGAGDKIKVEFERATERKTTTVTLKSRNVLEKRSE